MSNEPNNRIQTVNTDRENEAWGCGCIFGFVLGIVVTLVLYGAFGVRVVIDR